GRAPTSPDEAPPVDREHRYVSTAPPIQPEPDITAGEDSGDAGRRQGMAAVHSHDASTRNLAPHDGHVLHARQLDVGGVQPLPCQLGAGIDTSDRALLQRRYLPSPRLAAFLMKELSLSLERSKFLTLSLVLPSWA